MPSIPVGPIRCAQCEKPVDKWVIQRNEEKMQTEMVVYCHGDRDVMVLTDRELSDQLDNAIQEAVARGGVAFQTKRITNA